MRRLVKRKCATLGYLGGLIAVSYLLSRFL